MRLGISSGESSGVAIQSRATGVCLGTPGLPRRQGAARNDGVGCLLRLALLHAYRHREPRLRRGDPEPRDGRLPWDSWIATPPRGGSQ